MQEKKQYILEYLTLFMPSLIDHENPGRARPQGHFGEKRHKINICPKYAFCHILSLLRYLVEIQRNTNFYPKYNSLFEDKITNLVIDLNIFTDILIDDNRSPIFRIYKVWFYRLNPKEILIWRQKRNRAP
jgi:hypothetical protein